MEIQPGKINEALKIPASKSAANRLIILAALSEEDITITDIPKADDVVNLISCLTKIGIDISKEANQAVIKKSFPACETVDKELLVGEGGTTLHFLMALLSLGKRTYTLQMSDSLAMRPHDALIDALRIAGASARQINDKIIIQGPITNKKTIVNCDKSSQYASALELIKAQTDLEIDIENLWISKSFYNLTKECIKTFSKSNQTAKDMASLAYPFCFALLNQEILIENCHEIDFNQPDAEVFSYYKDNIVQTPKGLKILPLTHYRAFDINMNDCLDMIPNMAFLASYLKGTSKIHGIKNLVYKESNRIEAIINLLNNFGIKTVKEDDTLSIIGGNKITRRISPVIPYDHRMVMTAYLFLKHNGGGTLDNISSVKKSFPGFFKTLDK